MSNELMKRIDIENETCPMRVVQGLIAGKWKIMILWYLSQQVTRFGEFQRLLPCASKAMITQHLRELEEDGIVHREVYKEIPPKVEYSLTETGESFISVLNVMGEWGQNYIDNKKVN